LHDAGFIHFEELQLLVNNVAQDRISDFVCSILLSFLVDYTIDQCNRYSIPTNECTVNVYNCKESGFQDEKVILPMNPETKHPIVFAPKRWLRATPWINYVDYHEFQYATFKDDERFKDRIAVLCYNRENYGLVQAYVKSKETRSSECINDPLFKPIPVLSVKRKLKSLANLPTGKIDNADKEYEALLCPFLAAVLYPKLDFAAAQSRTASGVHIRDLIFYNNRDCQITQDIFNLYGSRQVVMELKNVRELNADHVDQLNRYLKTEFGSFGIILTRNHPPPSVYKNTIDLWSGQRRCILILTEEDIKLMGQLFESKQRLPIDVITKKYVEFSRDCPG
jgi:hypothetical protein